MKKLFNQKGIMSNNSKSRIILFISLIVFIFINTGFSQIAAWDFSTLSGGTNNFGPSPYDVTISNTNLTVGGLSRGAGCGTTGTGASHAWGANGYTISGTLSGEIAADKYWTFTITVNTGYQMSVTGIAAYNIRRSSTGPTSGQWQYKIGSGTFVNIGSEIIWGTITSSAGNPQIAIDLSTISDLQNVSAGTTITFRLVSYGASSNTGTCYLNDPLNTTDNDLIINGTVQPVGGNSPSVSTQNVSTIDTTFATGNGNITDIGSSGITTSGICWDTITAPTISGNHTTDGPTGSFTGTYTSSLLGLSVNKQYYVKAYATNSIGTGYGTEVNFWTLAKIPSAPTVNNPTSISLDVTINENGNPDNTEFAIRETGGQYVQSNGTLDTVVVWQSKGNWGVKTVSGLIPNTVYTFKVKARNGVNMETAFGLSTSDSTSILSGTGNTTGITPDVYDLKQNYPNPFNPNTKINFELAKEGNVKLVVYDVNGREIKTLVNNEFKPAGRYTVEFNGTQLASGIYFYRILVEGKDRYSAYKKMVLVK